MNFDKFMTQLCHHLFWLGMSMIAIGAVGTLVFSLCKIATALFLS